MGRYLAVSGAMILALSSCSTTEDPGETPAVVDTLNCTTVTVHTARVDCRRNGQTAVVTLVDADGPTVEDVVQRTASRDSFNEVADTFFEVPEGVLYLPGEFIEESIELADPDDLYFAEVIDTDLYVARDG